MFKKPQYLVFTAISLFLFQTTAMATVNIAQRLTSQNQYLFSHITADGLTFEQVIPIWGWDIAMMIVIIAIIYVSRQIRAETNEKMSKKNKS